MAEAISGLECAIRGWENIPNQEQSITKVSPFFRPRIEPLCWYLGHQGRNLSDRTEKLFRARFSITACVSLILVD